MSSQKIIVANWKLERSFARAQEWVATHRDDLSELAHKAELVLCPDIITTASLGQLLQGTGIALGAQDCSPYRSGKYTGAVSAQSLHDVGCTYVIIGHHEQRSRSTLTDSDYAVSCAMALQCGIIPVLCLGELAEDRFNHQKIKDLFATNLELLYRQYRSNGLKNNKGTLCIAYEPIWAIGSGDFPTADELVDRISSLRDLINTYDAVPATRIVYGGSVTAEHCEFLRDIPYLDGLLLGSSSLDMQSLKKIVYSFIK